MGERHPILWMVLLVCATAASERGAPDARQPCPPPPQHAVSRWPPEGPPQKVFHVDPEFPSRTTPTQFEPSAWVGEFDILTDGRVGEVRVLRPARIDPPWPEWEEAISAAIRKWRYGVPCVGGRPRMLRMSAVFFPRTRTFFAGEASGKPRR